MECSAMKRDSVFVNSFLFEKLSPELPIAAATNATFAVLSQTLLSIVSASSPALAAICFFLSAYASFISFNLKVLLSPVRSVNVFLATHTQQPRSAPSSRKLLPLLPLLVHPKIDERFLYCVFPTLTTSFMKAFAFPVPSSLMRVHMRDCFVHIAPARGGSPENETSEPSSETIMPVLSGVTMFRLDLLICFGFGGVGGFTTSLRGRFCCFLLLQW
mmetsp:Transcript_28984/g.61264  ORF Transcript_28984/g.61264 Transcript_28984/m.61264 type:complete len:216 (-) Transcript_28984:783-1430(-)